MLRKRVSIFCVAMVCAASLLVGCGEEKQEAISDDTTSQETMSEDISKQETVLEDTTKIVQVTEMDGVTITANVGELSADISDMQGGNPLEMPGDGNAGGGMPPEIAYGENANGGMPSEIPNGENANGEMPPEIAYGENANGEMPPEIPSGEGSNGGVPSEMPNGESVNGEMPFEKPDSENSNGGMTPQMPSGGDLNGGTPPEMPNAASPNGKIGGSVFTANGETITFTITDSTQITQEFQQGSEEVSAESIVKNSVLEIMIDSENQASKIVIKNLQAGSGFGGSNEVVNGTSANIISEETVVEAEEYLSEGDDENALRVDGADVTLNNITVKKTGGNSSNTENGDFYGQNAGLLVLNGSTAEIVGGTFQTDAVNGNAVFSYGEGTTVNISDANIRTDQNNSGGIQTTGGGTMNAINLDIQTEGNSSAAIRSDRGGGTVNVSKGKYVTNGTGSPAVYCTADISVEDATLIANASEGIVVEGKNSVSLKDCDVTGNMDHIYNGDSDENIHCIMIYQSMSGDASIGEADFCAEGGSITSKAGDLFYVTNTDCSIRLKNVALTLSNDIFLRVEGNSSARGWGTEGANGGDVVLSADSQKIEGNILVDGISSLKLSMSNGTEYVGSINPDGAGGVVDVVMDESSTWTLTGDSYISSFEGEISQVDGNGYHLYVDGEEVK